jgi:glycolate oxidase FAD binding subunit
MPAAVDNTLPLDDTLAPADEAAVARLVRDCAGSRRAVYTLGGQTSLDTGLPGRRRGIGLSLGSLNRVVDYPARDMTITVEAGLTIAELASTLAAENQWLPIDVPQATRATIGGVIATNTSGPRRFGQGTIRDYVIGIRAVDGRGVAFQAGGRVVKNVAGYDFCKLLCGSFGTLAVITQVTLKIKPRPQASAWAWCELPSLAKADELLAALATTSTTPTAIELVTGPPSITGDVSPPLASSAAARVLIGFEGTKVEVDWQLERLADEWRTAGASFQSISEPDAVADLWSQLTEFPVIDAAQSGVPSAVTSTPAIAVLKANVLPSKVTSFIEQLRQLAPTASIVAHAGSGVVLIRLAEAPTGGLAAAIVRHWQPAARAVSGNLVVLASREAAELTRQVVWGTPRDDARLQIAVKRQFDPHDILNPGRFVYGSV